MGEWGSDCLLMEGAEEGGWNWMGRALCSWPVGMLTATVNGRHLGSVE